MKVDFAANRRLHLTPEELSGTGLAVPLGPLAPLAPAPLLRWGCVLGAAHVAKPSPLAMCHLQVGLSKAMTRTFASQQGGVGTFAWAAPEVLQGKPCSFPADIYSFGVQGERFEGCAEHGLASLHSSHAWRGQPARTPGASCL